MKFETEKPKSDFIPLVEGTIIDSDEVSGTDETVSKVYGTTQYILFFNNGTAMTVSHSLFISLIKEQTETNATQFKCTKRINEKGRNQWYAIPLNPKGQTVL